MGMSWDDDEPSPTIPQLDDRLAERLMEALAARAQAAESPSTCTRIDLYDSPAMASAAIRQRRTGLRGWWRHRHWRHWLCGCGWYHIGPPDAR